MLFCFCNLWGILTEDVILSEGIIFHQQVFIVSQIAVTSFFMAIDVICHKHRWCTFFQLAYFFPQRTRKGPFWTCHAMPSQWINMPNKTNKYINQSNKYAISQYLFNRKNTATKTPSMPSQSKEYANQNTNYAISIKRITNQNTKYAISIKRVCQPKH